MTSTAREGPAARALTGPLRQRASSPEAGRARSTGTGGDAATGSGGAVEQLRWFSTLWLMALTVHLAAAQPLMALLVLLAGLPALLFPSSVAACGVLLATGAVLAVGYLPVAPNHLVMSLAVTLALGAAAIHVLATRRRAAEPFLPRWFDTARTPAGLVLLVVYFFAVFHKLNTGFFDPATSCAGTLLTALVERNGLGPLTLSPTVVQAAAVGTVLAEAAILVLVAVPRWRCWGVVLGVGFHATLALTGFAHFATFVFALYVLLLPRQVFDALAPRWSAVRWVAFTGLAAHVALSLVAGLAGARTSPVGLTWPAVLVATWFVAVGAFMVPLVRACLTARHAGVPYPPWRWRPAALLLVPLLAFGNGLLPYLGLKTVASYSMYSNLHTEEGRTNHLLPAVTAVELAAYQRDTVTVTALLLPDQIDLGPLVSNPDKYLAYAAMWTVEPRPVRVPWLELRRTVLMWRAAGIDGVGIRYERGGEPRVVADAITDPVLAAPLPWWERHLLAFRAVDSGAGPDRCRW